MTASLVVRRVRLIGRAGDSRFDFTKRITVITGPVASGKTSLLEMIKYGFGGDAVITSAVRRNVQAVELLIRIGDERFLVERSISGGRDVVKLTAANSDGEPRGEEQLMPVGSPELGTTVSDFFMSRLGIPQLRFPRSPREPDEDLTTVTFNDVYGLMYLDQDQIDGAIGYEGARHRKWRQTFEVVYGLADAELASLQTKLGEANAEHSRVASYVREVERFLNAVGYAAEVPGTVEPARERLERELAEVDLRLAQLRERTRAMQASSASRGEITRAERQVEEARTELARHLAERDSLRRVRAQVNADVEQVRRAASATELLRELEFESCPRCLQQLPHDRETGICRLCDQAEPPPLPNLNAEMELRRLERQLAETDELIAANDTDREQRAVALAQAEGALTAARAEWDLRSRQQVTPFLDQMAQLAERRGGLANALAEQTRAELQTAELAAARVEGERLRAEQRRLAGEAEAVRGRLRRGREALSALSEAYSDLIEAVEMPWVESASIDRRSYLPLVNGEPVRSLSSGGLKTIANFAFYLAQLQVRLRGNPTYLPPFMVIDSPRKNFGANETDAASMRRFYRTLWALRGQRTGTDFQVIVADNDSPSEERDQFDMLQLDRDHPLVDTARLRGGSDEPGTSEMSRT